MIATWSIDGTEATFEAEGVRTPTTRTEQSEYYLLTETLPPVVAGQIVFDAINQPGTGFRVAEILPVGTGFRINMNVIVQEFVTFWTGLDEFGRPVKESGAVKAATRGAAISQTKGILRGRGYSQLTVHC